VGDPTLLAQLAANLVQNAIRHNIRGGSVRIATVPDRRPMTVTLRVENTGATYTPEVAAQLSEPLVRGSGRISQGAGVPRGYGLGLALVSRITDVHHGDLTIVPRHGGGLVVTVSLPGASPGSRARTPGKVDEIHARRESKTAPSSGAALS
jgi:two-component system sensor histidine kinase VanS